ncbi:MAG: LLM class flavin-dependent oxidoreductase [Chloroflexi bacterium]|nr:LLM class flavin-dependent oxidoreductase [Chloroflexota bacterium]
MMLIGLQIPSFKVPGGTAAIRPNLKEIVTTAEAAGFYSLWVMDHYYQIKGLFGAAYTDPMLEAYTTLGYFAGLTESAYHGRHHAADWRFFREDRTCEVIVVTRRGNNSPATAARPTS